MRSATATSKTKSASLSLRPWLAFVVLMFVALSSVAVTASLATAAAADPVAVVATPVGSILPAANVVGVKQLLRGQALIDAVPMEARADFIAYQLAQALNHNISVNSDQRRPRFINPNAFVAPTELAIFEALPIYADFGTDLLFWLEDQFGMTQMDMYGLLRGRSIFCTAQGICYTQKEISGLCCPF